MLNVVEIACELQGFFDVLHYEKDADSNEIY